MHYVVVHLNHAASQAPLMQQPLLRETWLLVLRFLRVRGKYMRACWIQGAQTTLERADMSQSQSGINAHAAVHAQTCRRGECLQAEAYPCFRTQRSALESALENTTVDVTSPRCPATRLACRLVTP
jgi:hypothetical protein